jgi:hypothetical protein
LSIQHAIAHAIRWSKEEKEIDLFQDGGKIKKGKNIDHHGPDPPTSPLVLTFKVSRVQGRRMGIEKVRSGRCDFFYKREGESNLIPYCCPIQSYCLVFSRCVTWTTKELIMIYNSERTISII